MSADKTIFRINTTSNVPLPHQIKENLREAVENETLRPQDMLPSERELCAVYGVNRAAVRQALHELVQEGLLGQVPGLGTFVAEPKVVQVLPTVMGFSARMRQEGHTTLNRVLSQDSEPASASIARRLRIAQGAPVMRMARLRIVDNEPLMIETSFLSLDRFPDMLHDDFTLRSLYDVISARYGIHVLALDQTLEPVLMTAYEATLLNSTSGSPAMLMEVTAFADPDDPFEFSKAIVRGDKCQYYFRMRSSQ
jgi:GntR family transcriptional regulator